MNQLDRLVEVDQSPIGRTPRSNPATYTGVWNDIRRVFAGTKQARQRGYGTGRFSFNTKGGRCEECEGQGVRRIAMNFLPDLEVTCPVCHGARFNRQTLAVQYRDQVDRRRAGDEHRRSGRVLRESRVDSPAAGDAVDVGLGYLTLGQPSTTLSGGEAQRIKLATELGRRDCRPHAVHSRRADDRPAHRRHSPAARACCNRLVDQGNSVLVIEHNLDVIKTADWVIDLGPEGGAGGGRVVAAGTPEEIAAAARKSHGTVFCETIFDETRKRT